MSGEYPFPKRQALYGGEHQGIRWAIYQSPLSGVLNGYAHIPDGVTINVDDLKVHGGITYGCGDCTGWIGFDTAHTGDSWDVTELRQRVGVHVSPAGQAFQEQERSMWSGAEWERLWTVDALREECERLCEQIASVVAGAATWEPGGAQ